MRRPVLVSAIAEPLQKARRRPGYRSVIHSYQFGAMIVQTLAEQVELDPPCQICPAPGFNDFMESFVFDNLLSSATSSA
jgi:hypothetical protein